MKTYWIKGFIIFILILLFLTLFAAVFQMFALLKQHDILKRAWEKSLRVLDEKNRHRKALEKKSSSLYGELEKKSFVAKLDSNLAYGGLYTKFPKLTAETFLAAMLAGSFVVFIAFLLLTGHVGVSFAVLGVAWSAVYESICFVRAVRRKRIEEEILHCLDLLEMNALTSTDIIQIIGKTAVKVKKPLRTELLSAVTDAEHSGYSSPALRRLCNRIENKYLKDLILNLDICSRFKANYGEVLKAGKKIFMQDMANRQRMKKLYKNTFMYAMLMTGIGFFCLQQAGRLLYGSGDMITMLWTGGSAGRIILIFLGAVAFGSMWRSAVKAML